jgi:hypothetical protein
MLVQEPAKRRCSFPGCGRPHLAKGLCRGHYEQQRCNRALQPLPSRPRGDPACSFVGCGNVAVNRGLCRAHANQRKKGPVATSPRALLRHAGSLPIRWLLQTSCGTSCGWRFLRRPRRPILRRPPVGSALQTQGGMRLSWLHETPFRTRGTAKVTGGNFGKSGRLHPFARGRTGTYIGPERLSASALDPTEIETEKPQTTD